jgi:hypothetical protein
MEAQTIIYFVLGSILLGSLFLYVTVKYIVDYEFNSKAEKEEIAEKKSDQKYVTLGWDLKPTIVVDGKYVYPRRAELIFHEKYYPEGEKTVWPIDPETGEKLPIEP